MHIQARGIEGTGRIGPVGWPDDPFVAKSKNLAADSEIRSTFRRTAELNIGLADIPAVLRGHCIRNVMIEKDAGVLRLAKKGEPVSRLNGRVKPETAQQIGIVCGCVFYVIRAFDTGTVFAAESKPARQSVIQALNGEEPGAGRGGTVRRRPSPAGASTLLIRATLFLPPGLPMT